MSMQPSIKFVDPEVKKAVLDLGTRYSSFITSSDSGEHPSVGSKWATLTKQWQEARFTAAGYRRLQLSHLMTEVVTGPKEFRWPNSDGSDTVVRAVNILHIFPNRTFVTESLKQKVTGLISAAMHHMFRIDPDHQDFCIEWVDDMNAFCVLVLGADHDPKVHDRLMKVGVLVNGGLDRDGVLIRG